MNYLLPSVLYFLVIFHQNDAFRSHKRQPGQDRIYGLLRLLVEDINKDNSQGYADLGAIELPRRLPILDDEEDEPIYTDLIPGDPAIPSLRDREYLEHSPLYSSYLAEEDNRQLLKQIENSATVTAKTEVPNDSMLPAYCNPPNPCPLGFTVEDGCIQHFENTAAFSRKYQAAQKCMCDEEHMFDCLSPPNNRHMSYSDDDKRYSELELEKTKNMKKAYNNHDEIMNPFLQGEMLPIAAKKGINVGYY